MSSQTNLVRVPGEAGMVAAELADSYRDRVEHYRQYYKLPTGDAVTRAEVAADDPTYRQILLTRPPDQVSWRDLQALAETDPGLALKLWDGVRDAAQAELCSKARAAKALEGYAASPWDRAQFLALCQELADGWQPRNGIERQLLDTLALAQTAMLTWLGRLANWSTQPMKKDLSEGAGWEPPRLTEAEAVAQAMGMVERFQRIFTRTLRALCDVRRRPLSVVVQGAGQVNIGAQQVNVAGKEAVKAIGSAGDDVRAPRVIEGRPEPG
jgi:hypothetical protein